MVVILMIVRVAYATMGINQLNLSKPDEQIRIRAHITDANKSLSYINTKTKLQN